MESSSFAQRLRQLRAVSGMTLRELARAIDLTAGTLSRWECEQTTPRRDDVVKLDQALDARGGLLKLWTAQTSGTALPPWMQDVAAIMDEALSIECVSPNLVPGLLQCTEYADLVLSTGRPSLSREEVRALAYARGQRYSEIQAAKDPSVHVAMPIRAVTLMPESVRKAQAGYLCDIIDRGRVTVCLVPDDALVLGVVSPTVLMRLSDGTRAGSTDHLVGNQLLDPTSDWLHIDDTVRNVYTLALPSNRSRNILGEYL